MYILISALEVVPVSSNQTAIIHIPCIILYLYTQGGISS